MTLENTSIENIQKTVQDLCDFGQKVAGTEAEVKAAKYLYNRLKEFGFLKVEMQPFDVHGWNPRSSTVRISSPVQKEVESALFPYCKTESAEGLLVPLDGSDSDSPIEREGQIAYADWGADVYFGPRMSYFQAVNLGYKGLIVAGPEEELLKVVVIPCGSFLEIPVVCIRKEEGDSLRSMMEAGEVIVNIETEVEISVKSQSFNLVAILDGDGTTKHEVVVGAHYDSWFQGAADNCAPAATILELARIFHARAESGNVPKRTIRFLFYGAEESGSNDFYFWINGSKAYVRDNQDAVARSAAVLSLDSTGYTAPANNYVYATAELEDFAKSIRAEKGKVPSLTYIVPPSYGSDHWFFEISGVPTIYGVAHTSPLYHTQKDIPENLDFNAVHFYAEYMREALTYLSNISLLPINIFTSLERIEEVISRYTKMKESPVDLFILVNKVKSLRKRKSKFQKLLESARKEDITNLNEFLLNTANGFNRRIGFNTRPFETYTSDYLYRFEMIEDYVQLTNSINNIRSIPITNIDSDSARRIESQSDNPYNWLKIHDSLSNLEQERDRIRKEIEKEVASLSQFLDTISDEMTKLTIIEH